MSAIACLFESTFAWNELCILHCLYTDAVRRFTSFASSARQNRNSKVGNMPYTVLYVIYGCFFFAKYRVRDNLMAN